MARLYKILAIDGGGIRGIIPATVLMEIERQTGKGVAELFDLVAGTSTGGILAVGLAMANQHGRPAYSAGDLRELYLREASTIFPQSFWTKFKRPLAEKYSSSGIEDVLKKYFGDRRLKDSLCGVLATSYEIRLRQPWFFRSERAQQDASYDFPLWEVARATSAAPTYFSPARLERGRWSLIDGGTYANNPALCAYAEARQNHPGSEILLVSLGTGRHAQAIRYRPGLLGWAKPVLDVVFDGVSRTTEYQMEQLLPPVRGVRGYYRFQTSLADGEDDMDNIDAGNLARLVERAETLVAEKMGELGEVCRQLPQ